MLRNRHGFTFVEVTIAIAIFAFALITLIGLLSIGLSSEKASADDTRMASMADYVIATERQNSFATVSAANYTNNYYFDLYGNTNSQSASYAQCAISNISANSIGSSTNSAIVGPNVVSLKAVFTYPLAAPATSRMTNVYYYNRSNQ